jgi:hypothetical protein
MNPNVQSEKIVIVLLLGSLNACSALLPKSDTTIKDRWDSFESARSTFDQIIPYQTSTTELVKMGYDPFSNPAMTILTYGDIIRRLIPPTIIDSMKLNRGVVDCVSAQEQCQVYEVDLKRIQRKRSGNFWLDFLNFRRRTEISGWRFTALILLSRDLVVYKLWSGQPVIREVEEVVNPLGPLQGSGETAVRGLIR